MQPDPIRHLHRCPSNLDGDKPQYISDNTDDEISHVAFLNAYLVSKGEQPVDSECISQFLRRAKSRVSANRTAYKP